MTFWNKITRRIFFVGLLFAALPVFTPALNAQEVTKIKLGVMDGPEAEAWKTAQEVAKKNGLDIELVYFSDYSLPNEAVNSNEIDANAFQHTPYFDAQVEQRGYKLSIAGYTVLYPVGVYSHKIKDLSQLRDGAIVGIPNDPSNGGRALRLLDKLGLIKLKNPNDVLASTLDVVENPKKLDIRELDAGMLGRAIDDFDIAVINTNWAISTGLNPEKDVIAREEAQDNPYNNIIVVRTADLDKPWVKTLVSSYNSEPVREAIKNIFGANAVTSW